MIAEWMHGAYGDAVAAVTFINVYLLNHHLHAFLSFAWFGLS